MGWLSEGGSSGTRDRCSTSMTAMRCTGMTALTDDSAGPVDGHDIDEARPREARRREPGAVAAQVDVELGQCVLEARAADAAALGGEPCGFHRHPPGDVALEAGEADAQVLVVGGQVFLAALD